MSHFVYCVGLNGDGIYNESLNTPRIFFFVL